MPEGYESGDKPNPNLRAFVEQHIKDRPNKPATPRRRRFGLILLVKNSRIEQKTRRERMPTAQTLA